MHELVEKIKRYFEAKQLLHAGTRGAWLLAVLGLVSGLLVGVVVILFRLLIEMVQSSFLPAADPENYELLSWSERLLLLAAGGLVLATLLLVQDALESLDLSKAGFLKKNFQLSMIIFISTLE
jgi:hypothetical protein